MKKILSLCLFTCFAAACAGNPPAWWNPNNRYGTADGSPAAQPAAPKKILVVQEEEIDLPDMTYEEVTLTPISDEENENMTGASAAQNDENLPQPSVLD